MKETINQSQFIDRFKEMNRKNNFSYEGKKALFEYLTDLEEDTGQETELDIISICCDYNEYENIKEFWNDYDKETYPDIDAIREHTTVIEIDNESFIIQAF